MLELTTKQEFAKTAKTIAQSYELVQHGGNTYIPAHWLLKEIGPCEPKDRTWIPLSRDDKRRLGNQVGKILFATDSEVTNFDLMLRQFAIESTTKVSRLLVRTESGLKELTEDGQLTEPDGSFKPNCVEPMLNTDSNDKAEVFKVISEWLNSEEEATSLLYHLATSLSPGWSAVKYLLFIGDGRNGKSVLLSMLADLYGHRNISNVTRQQMAERLPVCVQLNDKLLNIIWDGELSYIKDSSMEKTLVAGEPGYVRLLYENGNSRVQTNALFLEALNREPKSRDKSSALQKRLARFWFPNVYPIDKAFEAHMRSERMLGALLGLLLDHFVPIHEVAEKLQQTKMATELQVEQQLLNSPLLQFVQYLVLQDGSALSKLETGGLSLDALSASFMAWRVQEGFSEFSTADVNRMLREGFDTTRKSERVNGKPRKKWVLLEPKPDVQALLDLMKGDEDYEDSTALVADG